MAVTLARRIGWAPVVAEAALVRGEALHARGDFEGANATTSEGSTALHLASQLGNTGQVCLLLKHRADHHKRNYEGKLDIISKVEIL